MIESLKDLEKLLKLCRKQGVTEIKIGSVDLKFGDLPMDYSKTMISDELDPLANFPQGELTSQQLEYYAQGGLPENDPYRNDL